MTKVLEMRSQCLHWCQLKQKTFSNLVSSLEAGNAALGGSAASKGGGASTTGIPSLRLGTRQISSKSTAYPPPPAPCPPAYTAIEYFFSWKSQRRVLSV
ncbi:hypothetical protein [Nostoc commune]|uniref:hypothetical protein n=1 Tax=Nostoc commune TaxID=1178 RepID=UPI002072B496|nr:hypothetical protein [Nostoc commune]